MEQKNYIYLLSVVSAFAVVTLHTNAIFWTFSTESYWFWANITECVFYFAVPIFFMISGITLIDYNLRYSTRTYFIKRCKKALIPFISWSLFGLLYCIIIKKNILIDDLSFTYIVNGILNTSFVCIYWFFIPLFILYLAIPVLSAIDTHRRLKIYLYIVLLTITLNSLFPFINKIFSLNINYHWSFCIGGEAVLYALIGYILSKCNLSRKNTILISILGLLGLIVHIVGTYILSIKAGKIVDTYKGYYNIPCIFYSTAIFIFLKNISDFIFKNEKLRAVILFLKDYTFAIYLIHWFILDFMSPNLKYAINRLGLPFVIIPICIIITYFVRKIPILKKILP